MRRMIIQQYLLLIPTVAFFSHGGITIPILNRRETRVKSWNGSRGWATRRDSSTRILTNSIQWRLTMNWVAPEPIVWLIPVENTLCIPNRTRLETLPWISVLTAEKLYTVDSIILVMENSTLSFGVPVVATPNRLRNQIQWTGCFILFRNNYKYNIWQSDVPSTRHRSLMSHLPVIERSR